METTGKFRYYDAVAYRQALAAPAAAHTEFLRSGPAERVNKGPPRKRYFSQEDVAARTGLRLERAGEGMHRRIDGFHPAIRFPKLVFHRTLTGMPHLGYCHVTAATSHFAEFGAVRWAFYVTNFRAEIGGEDQFFADISAMPGRMYFAVALLPGGEDGEVALDRRVRGNGVLFSTTDPKTAMKAVLRLGARDEPLRALIQAL